MLKLRHPFFNPLWRRVAVVVFTAAWGMVELFWGAELFWAIVFFGLSGVCAWVFLYDWQDVPEDQD